MINDSRYRSKINVNKAIGISIAWQHSNLLSRGLGLEHLRELLVRLARPLLRTGASLAYAGHWKESEDNFTHELLRLISAEQEDNSIGGPDTNLDIGRLYNHSAWPDYLSVTPRIEAQWINSCRIVRITQEMAGIAKEDIVPDAEAASGSARARFNAAVTLSAMRRLMMQTVTIPIPDVPQPEKIPPVEARILLGGKISEYRGFLPGLFEEALVTLQKNKPLFILGGFGGASEILACAATEPDGAKRPEFTLEWQKETTPALAAMLEESKTFALPTELTTSDAALSDLAARLTVAQESPAEVFSTGLSDQETRTLLKTSDPDIAVKLVKQGLNNRGMLSKVAA